MPELRVQKVENTCLFELTWGSHQRLTAQIPFSGLLWSLYEDWQRLYLNFYNTQLRGRAMTSGTGYAPPRDVQSRLGEAEARLLSEFHRWLRHPDLYDISSQIALLASQSGSLDSPRETLSICCTPLDLARLPWESWEVSRSLSMDLLISRTTSNLRYAPVARRSQRLRVLVIIGDDTGLDFQQEKLALQSLFPPGTLHFVGWQPGKSLAALETEIKQAIADPQGWDMLFFAGHSNETRSTGGELGIAPNTFMSIHDITPQLAIAQQNGLQFALFNSCKGLGLAESLINLGFSQVAVMREPVHNRVAEEFLVQFLQHLARYRDVQESLQAACDHLKVERNLTYPSAYLIPSLFHHPDMPLFRLEPPSWKRTLRQLLPRRYEVMAIAALCLLSWQLSMQQWLLERRVLAQAIYRDVTQRTEVPGEPPTLLVQIDEASLRQEGRMRPLPRGYLGRILDRLAGAPVIGVDYLLDFPDPEDPKLAQSLAQASQQGSQIVLGTSPDRNTGEWRYANETLANPDWVLPGNMNVRGVHYVELLYADPLPLSFTLASLQRACFSSQGNSLGQNCHLKQPQREAIADVSQMSRFYPRWLTVQSYGLGQMWLHPIIDYSLPPEQIYSTLSAQELLNPSTHFDAAALRQSVIVVPNYASAGIDRENEDNFRAPAAFQYWHDTSHKVLTGGEYHAYLLHQYLNRRFVVPLPDVWFVLLGALLGKSIHLLWKCYGSRRGWGRWGLVGGTALFMVLSLEIYLSPLALLIPIVLPVVAFWVFAFPILLPRQALPHQPQSRSPLANKLLPNKS